MHLTWTHLMVALSLTCSRMGQLLNLAYFYNLTMDRFKQAAANLKVIRNFIYVAICFMMLLNLHGLVYGIITLPVVHLLYCYMQRDMMKRRGEQVIEQTEALHTQLSADAEAYFERLTGEIETELESQGHFIKV